MSKDIARLAEEAKKEAHDHIGLLLAAFKQGNTDPMETIALHAAIDRALRLAALAARVQEVEYLAALWATPDPPDHFRVPKWLWDERDRVLALAEERCDSCGSTDPKTRYVVVVQTGLDERDTRCENDEFHGKETI